MKRYLKFTLLGVLLLAVGFLAYAFFNYPAMWYPLTRRESVKILTRAKGTNELAQLVGRYGLLLQLTNSGWIAIRFRDAHRGFFASCAVARDSEGNWFESDRHFCGSLSFWPRFKETEAAEQETREKYPDLYTNKLSRAESDNGMFPSYREMMAVEAATNMMAAREALQAIGFKPLIK